MTKVTELQRNSCLLHGALQTVKAIERAIPIIHSTTGCGIQQYFSGTSLSGNNGSGFTGGLSIPSSNVIEKQVVFGGTSRLREQIKNTLKVQEGDVYVVLTGCTTELVGDDAPAMAKEVQEQGYPVILASTPGFKGETHHGYTLAVKSIIQQLEKFAKASNIKTLKSVNIFGIIPEQDVFWRGNLAEIKRVLEAVGIKVNTLLGFGQGVGKWGKIPSAELNIAISSWGLPIAELIEEKYKVPYIYFENIPVGIEDTSNFVKAVSKKLNVEDNIVNEFVSSEEKKVAYFIESALDSYFKYNYKRRFAIVGDSSLAIGITKFLSNPLGLIPEVIIITDDVDLKIQQEIEEKYKSEGVEVIFDGDGKTIREAITGKAVELILGSSLEKKLASNLRVPLLEVSFPIANSLVLNKGYAGYNGGITLLQDLGTAIIQHEEKSSLKGEK
ncbi:MAG: nitrogenase component 1 [Clostridiaceae bacterium]